MNFVLQAVAELKRIVTSKIKICLLLCLSTFHNTPMNKFWLKVKIGTGIWHLIRVVYGLIKLKFHFRHLVVYFYFCGFFNFFDSVILISFLIIQ